MIKLLNKVKIQLSSCVWSRIKDQADWSSFGFRLLLLITLSGLSAIVLSPIVSAHPLDEALILDIELGEMQLQPDQINAEYLAALKRKQQRRLAAMSWSDRFTLYVVAGYQHIIPKGLDHIIFILGLCLSSLWLTALLWQATAFTFAHSITLALATFGIIALPPQIIEPLIALSILWIAIENYRQPPATTVTRSKPWIVFIFGLLHGLGFATVLNEYGLPRDDFISALLAFNIGVELGQISIILIVFMLIMKIKQRIWFRSRIQQPCGVIIGLMAIFWLWERLMG